MNKRQIDQYTMLHRVATHFDINPTIWGSNVLISDTKTALSTKLEQIMAAAALQSDNSTGATLDKASLRKDLEEKAFFITLAICAYTSLNPGQKELYQTVFITKTALSRSREAELLLYIERLHEAAESILENIAPYGVTESVIAELIAARTAFYDIMTTPAAITSSRKDATKAISYLLHQAMAILDDTMDRIIVVLRPSQPQFVNVYFNDRKIHPTGTRTISLEITTINAIDKSPLAEAQIEIIGKKIKRISSKKGKNKVQNLKEGNYTLSVTHPDFVSQMIPFTIISGETTQIVVELEEVAEV